MSDEEETPNPQNNEFPNNLDPNDTIKILLATDCHLGYERTTKRDQQCDSLITFEEILKLAKEHEVDFILLGGDLFHETKPPQDIMSKCIALLKEYCMGTRDVKIQILTDPEVIFKDCGNKTVNFEDPNLNISIPVFSIHGNHDDPSSGATGSLDLLSVTGLVNYFGKWTNLEKIEIPPLIIKKGETYISLYGLSYINDKRLARLMRDGNFKMLRATEIPESFNMFVLHQNRTCHGFLNSLNFIKQEKLPKFLNFIMWGHEHECRIRPEHFDEPNYYISQPGSSVATSLSDAEAKPKYVGLLSVNKTNFNLKRLKLETVRPFVLGNVSVSKDMPELENKSKELWPDLILKHVRDYIEFEMMPKAERLLSNNPLQPKLPLIRVRVHITSDDQHFENNKISQIFCEDVANPMDIILFVRESRKRSFLDGGNSNEASKFFEFGDIYDEREWNKSVQEGICKYFAEEENSEKLTVFSVNELNDALAQFTDTDNLQAFDNLVQDQKVSIIDYLVKQDIDFNNEDNIKEKLIEFQKNRILHNGEDEEFLQMRQQAAQRRREREAKENRNRGVANNDNSEGDGDEEEVSTSSRSRGRGRGRGRGGRGRSKTKTVVISDDEVEEDEEEQQPSKTRGRGRGRTRGRGESTTLKRDRGRAAKADNSVYSFLNVTTSKAPSKTPAFKNVARFQSRDDDFIDSD